MGGFKNKAGSGCMRGAARVFHAAPWLPPGGATPIMRGFSRLALCPLPMPIYAYLCSQCGFRKDVLQKLSDAALSVCPHCGAAAFEKQLSAPSFQLKGTGWYATDFKNSGKPAASTSNESKGDGDGQGGSNTTEAAPAPAPAAATSAANAAPASAPAPAAS